MDDEKNDGEMEEKKEGEMGGEGDEGVTPKPGMGVDDGDDTDETEM